MQREHVHSSPFSNEAIAFAAEARHWIARHKLLVIMGTTAIALGFCSLGSLVVQAVTTEYIPDIHDSYLPNSFFMGSHSICRPDEQSPGGPSVMEDHGGITIMMTRWGPQVYHHAPAKIFCEPSNWR